MLNQYSIFQKYLTALHYSANFTNISLAIEVDGKFDIKLVNNFCKLLILYLPEVKASYTHTQVLPLNVSDEEFIQSRITQVSNQDDNWILLKNHNQRLDLEHGETFKIILNTKTNKSCFIFIISHVLIDGISSFILCILLNLMFQKKLLKLFMFKRLLNKANKNRTKFLHLKQYQFNGFNQAQSAQFQPKFPFSQHKAISILFEFEKPLDSHKYSGNAVTNAALQVLGQICPQEKVVMVRRLLNLREKLPFVNKLALGNFYIPQPIEYNLSDFDSYEKGKKVIDATFNSDNIDATIESIFKSEIDIDKYCFDKFLSKNISLTISSLKFDKANLINGFDFIGGATIVGTNPYNHSLTLQIIPIKDTLKFIYLCDHYISNSTFTINFLMRLFKKLELDYKQNELERKVLDQYKLIDSI